MKTIKIGAAIDVDFLKRGSCTTSMILRIGDFSRQLFPLLSEGDFDKSQWTGKQQLHGRQPEDLKLFH